MTISQPDSRVLARRSIHIAIAEWEARWAVWFQVVGACVGLFLVFLPAVSKSWHTTIKGIPVFLWVYEEFSRFGSIALTILFVAVFLNIMLHLFFKHFPGSWDVQKECGFPTANIVKERRLYPINRAEELMFWMHATIGLFGFFVWIYMPFGVLAYFIRIPMG